MGIDGVAGNVIDQIGLEDYGLASDIDRKEPQTGREDLIKLLGVVLCVQDGNS